MATAVIDMQTAGRRYDRPPQDKQFIRALLMHQHSRKHHDAPIRIWTPHHRDWSPAVRLFL